MIFIMKRSLIEVMNLLDEPESEGLVYAHECLIPLVESLRFLELQEPTEEITDLMEEVKRWIIECDRYPSAYVTIKE
jgi:hypothetical protein